MPSIYSSKIYVRSSQTRAPAKTVVRLSSRPAWLAIIVTHTRERPYSCVGQLILGPSRSLWTIPPGEDRSLAETRWVAAQPLSKPGGLPTCMCELA